MLPDRLAQDIQSCLGDQLFLAGAPQLLIDEIVINTSEPDAVATKDIASFHAVTELAIEEELVAIRKQLAAVAVLKDSASSFPEPSAVGCPVPCSRSEPCHFETPPPGIARPQ